MKEPGLGIRGSGLVLTLTILASLHLPACKRKPAAEAASLYPGTNEVAGWAKTGETRTFPADNLWEYIDGDANRYLNAGVVTTFTTDYRFQDKIDAVADICVMKAPEGAKKLLQSERSADAQPSPVGDEGLLYSTSLVFIKGRCLVRLIAYDQSPEIGSALVKLGRAIEGRLGAVDQLAAK